MRLTSTVVLLGTLGTVACQQIWDIVRIEGTRRHSSLYLCLDTLLFAKVANNMGPAGALHLFPAHSRPDKFRNTWYHRKCGYCH